MKLQLCRFTDALSNHSVQDGDDVVVSLGGASAFTGNRPSRYTALLDRCDVGEVWFQNTDRAVVED